MSRIVCLYKKIFSHTKKQSKREIELYDAILFNFEGEKRCDIVTSIERHDTLDTNILVYGTCVHGLIGSTSVEKCLGSVK